MALKYGINKELFKNIKYYKTYADNLQHIEKIREIVTFLNEK